MKNKVFKRVMVCLMAGITACIAFSGCTSLSSDQAVDHDHHLIVYSALHQELDGIWVREDGSQKFVINGCNYDLIDSEGNTIEKGTASRVADESDILLYYSLVSSDSDNKYEVDCKLSEDNKSILKMRDKSGDIYIYDSLLQMTPGR